MEDGKFEYRHGSMDELLVGEGKLVKTFEDLYGSPRSGGLVTPRFVGVFQNMAEEIPRGLKSIYEKLFQLGFKINHGEEDSLHPNLISVVYDHKTWKEDIVRMMMKGDVSRRIKLQGYDPTPNFDMKYAPSFSESLENRRLIAEDGPMGDKILQDTCGVFQSAKRKFGLTRDEAGFYMVFSMHAENLKGVPAINTTPEEYAILTEQADETRKEIDELKSIKKPKKD
jgi:hypothetical protein